MSVDTKHPKLSIAVLVALVLFTEHAVNAVFSYFGI